MKWDPSMIEIVLTRPTTSVAVAITAAMLAGPLQYPHRDRAYEIHLVGRTYSDFMEGLAKQNPLDNFAQHIGQAYNTFAERQVGLGAEFEAAIFSDLESLYEA